MPCSGARWLLMSTEDCSLGSICDAVGTTGLATLSVRFSASLDSSSSDSLTGSSAGSSSISGNSQQQKQQQQQQPQQQQQLLLPQQLGPLTELVVGCEHHLHALLGAVEADHMFCVEPEQEAPLLPADVQQQQKQQQQGLEASAAAQAGKPHTGAGRCIGQQWRQGTWSRGSFAALLDVVSMRWAYRCQVLAAAARGPGTRLSLVTRGRHPVQGPGCWGEEEGCRCASSGGVAAWWYAAALPCLAHALGRTQFMEQRSAHGTAVDLPRVPTARKPTAGQMQWLVSRSGEYCCAIRGGQLHVQRLVKPRSAPRRRQLHPRRGATCVVSGGTQGLGLQCAQALARRGAGCMVITSRSGLLTKEELIQFAKCGEFGKRG